MSAETRERVQASDFRNLKSKPRSRAILTTLLSFIFVLGVLVFVHELGHFLVAKKCGMKVEQFSLGYPPKAFGVTVGETEYLISWLPLGGYVKVAGMSDFGKDDPEGKPWEFQSKPRWMQASVMAAGPAMNIILGFLLILTIRVAYGDYAYLTQTTLGGVEPQTALYDAGIRAGDRIVQIDGQPVDNWGQVFDGLAGALGSRIDLAVDRAGEQVLATAVLDNDPMKLGIHPPLLPIVGQVMPGYPAEGTGLEGGDIVTSVDGTPVTYWWEMSQIIEARADQEVSITWVRPDEGRAEMSATITPKGDEVGGEIVGRIGISRDLGDRVPVPLGQAVTRSGEELLLYTGSIFAFLERLISGRGSSNELAGPVAIAQMAGKSAERGLEALFSFMALLSVNLAVLNLLPIPMLDGGHLFIMGIETIVRRDLSVKQKEVLQQVGFVFLLALMIYVTANDIGRWLTN
ncbi:MAG: RIP metalloprotease RseP [Gemmatimonadetes bacterium]|nr:RIP metalloprotease RseP [Gemmatimonadota bacterium]